MLVISWTEIYQIIIVRFTITNFCQLFIVFSPQSTWNPRNNSNSCRVLFNGFFYFVIKGAFLVRCYQPWKIFAKKMVYAKQKRIFNFMACSWNAFSLHTYLTISKKSFSPKGAVIVQVTNYVFKIHHPISRRCSISIPLENVQNL